MGLSFNVEDDLHAMKVQMFYLKKKKIAKMATGLIDK